MSAVRKGAAIALAGLSFGLSAAQTGPAGLVFFGANAVKESMNSSAPITKIVGGQEHAVALRADGTVITWGGNESGQCNIPYGITNAVQVAAGDLHTIVLRADGTVAVFGFDMWGQRDVPKAGPYTIVAAGGSNSLVELQNGTVWLYGELAYQDAQQIPSFQGAAQLAVGSDHALAMDNQGNVTGFGNTVIPSDLGQCTAIFAGGQNSAAITKTGMMRVWGSGWVGSTVIPPPTNLQNVVQVSLSETNGIAIQQGGTVTVWGLDSFQGISNAPASLLQACACYQSILGLKGDSTVAGWGDPRYGKITIPQHLYGVIGMSAGFEHAAFLMNNGSLNAWGDNRYGQCNVPAGTGFAQVTAGLNHTVAYGSTQPLAYSMVGDPSLGQLTIPSGTPTLDKIWAAGDTTYGHVLGGGLRAWGQNGDGEFALQTSMPDALFVTGGYSNCYGIGLDNSLHGAGSGGSGQLPIPGNVGSTVQVSGMNQHVISVDNTGTMHTWGSNNYHQLDQVPAGALSGVQQVGAGYEHSIVLKTDGSVLAWGGNESEQSPAPAGLTGIAQIAAGGYFNVCLPKVTMSAVPYSIVQGQAGIGTVYLPQKAPSGGTIVYLQCNNPSVTLNMGTNAVVVPANAYQATFPIQVGGVSAATQVFITATLGNCSQTSMITIVPPAFAITANLPSVVGGSTDKLTANIVLASPAPGPAGVDVQISTSDASLTPLQSSVHINPGQVSPATPATFSSNFVTANKNLTIYGKYATQTLSCKVQVQPFVIDSFVFNPTSLLGGGNAFAIVGLNDTPATPLNVTFATNNFLVFPSPGVIGLTSNANDLWFPTNYTGLSTPVTVTATLNGVTTSTVCTVLPAISLIQFASAPWYGACHSSYTCYFPAPTPSNGMTLKFQGDGNCTPAIFTLPLSSGYTNTGALEVYGADVSTPTVTTMTASVGVINYAGQGTILPNTVSSMVMNNGSTFSVSAHPGTALLAVSIMGAPDYDLSVALKSSLPDIASFTNSTLTIPAGSKTANATLKLPAQLNQSVTLTLTATRLGQSKTLTITLLP